MFHARIGKFILAAVVSSLLNSQATATSTAQPSVEIKEWFALGSGCRARHNAPGDVQLSSSSLKTGTGLKGGTEKGIHLSLQLSKYKLDGNSPIRPDHPTFAKECALRLSVFPSSGSRIKEVRTVGNVDFRKDFGAKMRIATQMLLGETLVAQRELEFDKDRNIFSGHESLNLVASSENPIAKAALLSQACGAPRIVGVDLSFTNWRESKTPAVSAQIASNGEFSIEILTESCEPAPSNSQNK